MQNSLNTENTSVRNQFALLLRKHEIQIVSTLLGNGQKKILEIGGGNGWQAHQLHKLGYDITSIDISPQTGNSAYFPVMKYDGQQIPFKDASFDVVFSSNVLEHIAHIDNFEQEIHRVLTPEGKAIHVLPTSVWRIWTSITHPFQVFQALRQILFSNNRRDSTKTDNHTIKNSWQYVFWPNRHGEKGNSFTEIYWFSTSAWSRHFKKAGWSIDHTESTHLFYTGQLTMGLHLPIRMRRIMARILGSATKVYILSSPTK